MEYVSYPETFYVNMYRFSDERHVYPGAPHFGNGEDLDQITNANWRGYTLAYRLKITLKENNRVLL
jgi:hypothetical protein